MRVGISSRGHTYVSTGLFAGAIILFFRGIWDIFSVLLGYSLMGAVLAMKYMTIGVIWFYRQVIVQSYRAIRWAYPRLRAWWQARKGQTTI